MLKIKTKHLVICALILAAIALVLLVILCHIPRPQPQPKKTEPAPTFQYSPQDFSLDAEGFMTYSAGTYTTGIDVSSYQGQIDWQQVADAGIQFVFIRIGSRGTTEGKLYADTAAQSYYEGAKAAGLQVGAYFFSQAVTPGEAREEAEFAARQIARWELDLPLAYDWEWGGENSRTTGLDKEILTQCARAFCETVSDAGFQPMIYFNESQGLDQMELSRLSEYPFWLAMYDETMDFPCPVEYWQYSATGTVAGISGNVDLNISIAP